MKRFEYHILKFDLRGGFFSWGGKVDAVSMDVRLNQLGAEGWELVSSFDTSYAKGSSRDLVLVLKRELSS